MSVAFLNWDCSTLLNVVPSYAYGLPKLYYCIVLLHRLCSVVGVLFILEICTQRCLACICICLFLVFVLRNPPLAIVEPAQTDHTSSL